jgi:hypothetical protein
MPNTCLNQAKQDRIDSRLPRSSHITPSTGSLDSSAGPGFESQPPHPPNVQLTLIVYSGVVAVVFAVGVRRMSGRRGRSPARCLSAAGALRGRLPRRGLPRPPAAASTRRHAPG